MGKPKIIERYEKEKEIIRESSLRIEGEFKDYNIEGKIRRDYKSAINAKHNQLSSKFGLIKSYKEIKDLEEAVKYYDSLNTPEEINRNKQGTARQLALAFSFMVKAKHLPKGTLDSTKNAEFIEFLTGKGYENVRKKLGNIKLGQVAGITSEKEIKNLINDLIILRNIFDTVQFKDEVELISKYLDRLNGDLKSLME